jgi:hydrogenase maturation protease
MSDKESTVCLISVGNSMRGDDGIAAIVCSRIAEDHDLKVVHYQLDSFTGQIVKCLQGYECAIIVDAFESGKKTGEISEIDLNEALASKRPLEIKSCHGFSLCDELRLSFWVNKLPKKLFLMGIEVDSCDWGEGISIPLQAKLDSITSKLKLLVCRLETEKAPNAFAS